MFLGTDITRIDEDLFSVFARNAKALKEAVDRINEITTIKVQTLGFYYGAHAKIVFISRSNKTLSDGTGKVQSDHRDQVESFLAELPIDYE